MPTVVALDVSLSMTRPVTIGDNTEEFQRRHLAIHGINTLLDHFTVNCKLEFTSVVLFSYLWEQLVPFTRDVESIKTALTKLEEYNKTCFESVLAGISTLVVEEWGTATSMQVILITDGNMGVGPGSLKETLKKWKSIQAGEVSDEKCPLPFPFHAKLHVMCIANPNDPALSDVIPLYQQLIDLNNKGGEVYVPEGNLSFSSIQAMFQRLADSCYSPYYGLLRCGNLKCNVTLFPPPERYCKQHEFELVQKSICSTLDICGFLDLHDISSPPTLSRHLVLPAAYKADKLHREEKDETEKSKEEEEDSAADEGKVPSFTVLLHGSLKVEGMVAITKVGEDWFGMLYSWADSKKKSSLMLSLFEPGAEAVTWIGDIKNLAPISDFTENPYGEDDNRTPFPVRPLDKRSYAQSCVVWIKAVGLQADMQKVIRHAKKLPDKQQQFYKELNRIRKAALAFGFHELLDAMGAMLERECTMLPGTAHPDAALQLTHAATKLRSEMSTDPAQLIMPLRTNFTTDTDG
ncbi:hypothetical protein CHS0354_025040 [Potamilus streckersoni]|uniref:Integrator complex subunit 14 n=1 Tax=Potamilus streckersoni TaxID=2493646 RepID=A0AAE0TA54_9BIVA|nr:hypothetical protein CHS0354_025040 [Potamilus streckersoni]